MIGIKLWRSRTGLLPTSARRAAAAVALAFASACGPRQAVVYTWRGTPDVVLDQRIREIKRRAAEEEIAELTEPFKHGAEGVVLEIDNCPPGVSLEIEIYADPRIPKAAAITDDELDVIIEPSGYVNDTHIKDFYTLIAADPDTVKTWIEDALREIYIKNITVATYRGPRTHPLRRLIAWIKATKNWSFHPRNAIPLWYRPWPYQLARDLYQLSPPDYRRLAGPTGIKRAVRKTGDLLLKTLQKYYHLEREEKTLRLYPKAASPPTKSHEAAVKHLEKILQEVYKEAAEKVIQTRDLRWPTYVDAVTQALENKLKQS
jgi:hypothetical protein